MQAELAERERRRELQANPLKWTPMKKLHARIADMRRTRGARTPKTQFGPRMMGDDTDHRSVDDPEASLNMRRNSEMLQQLATGECQSSLYGARTPCVWFWDDVHAGEIHSVNFAAGTNLGCSRTESNHTDAVERDDGEAGTSQRWNPPDACSRKEASDAGGSSADSDSDVPDFVASSSDEESDDDDVDRAQYADTEFTTPPQCIPARIGIKELPRKQRRRTRSGPKLGGENKKAAQQRNGERTGAQGDELRLDAPTQPEAEALHHTLARYRHLEAITRSKSRSVFPLLATPAPVAGEETHLSRPGHVSHFTKMPGIILWLVDSGSSCFISPHKEHRLAMRHCSMGIKGVGNTVCNTSSTLVLSTVGTSGEYITIQHATCYNLPDLQFSIMPTGVMEQHGYAFYLEHSCPRMVTPDNHTVPLLRDQSTGFVYMVEHINSPFSIAVRQKAVESANKYVNEHVLHDYVGTPSFSTPEVPEQHPAAPHTVATIDALLRTHSHGRCTWPQPEDEPPPYLLQWTEGTPIAQERVHAATGHATNPRPIQYLDLPGGILDDAVLSRADAITQQLNCVGCDGAGLAAAVAKKLPYGCSYKHRRRSAPNSPFAVKADYATMGDIDVRAPPAGSQGPTVINLFAQLNMGAPGAFSRPSPASHHDLAPARESAFKTCLSKIGALHGNTRPRCIAFPYNIGCGLGGGTWSHYAKMIQDFANDNTDMEVLVCRWTKGPEQDIHKPTVSVFAPGDLVWVDLFSSKTRKNKPRPFPHWPGIVWDADRLDNALRERVIKNRKQNRVLVYTLGDNMYYWATRDELMLWSETPADLHRQYTEAKPKSKDVANFSKALAEAHAEMQTPGTHHPPTQSTAGASARHDKTESDHDPVEPCSAFTPDPTHNTDSDQSHTSPLPSADTVSDPPQAAPMPSADTAYFRDYSRQVHKEQQELGIQRPLRLKVPTMKLQDTGDSEDIDKLKQHIHRLFGHLSLTKILNAASHMQNSEVYKMLRILKGVNADKFCEACELFKSRLPPIPKGRTERLRIQELPKKVYLDFIGYIHEPSVYNNYHYALAATTNRNYCDLVGTAVRSQAILAISKVLSNLGGFPPELQVDAAGELDNPDVSAWLTGKGPNQASRVTVIPPGHHWANGRIERLIQLWKGMVRAMLWEAGLPTIWWFFALKMATVIGNIVNKARDDNGAPMNISAYEAHFGVAPDVSRILLGPFGCACFFILSEEQRQARNLSGTFGMRSLSGIYLGPHVCANTGIVRHFMTDGVSIFTTSHNIRVIPDVFPGKLNSLNLGHEKPLISATAPVNTAALEEHTTHPRIQRQPMSELPRLLTDHSFLCVGFYTHLQYNKMLQVFDDMALQFPSCSFVMIDNSIQPSPVPEQEGSATQVRIFGLGEVVGATTRITSPSVRKLISAHAQSLLNEADQLRCAWFAACSEREEEMRSERELYKDAIQEVHTGLQVKLKQSQRRFGSQKRKPYSIVADPKEGGGEGAGDPLETSEDPNVRINYETPDDYVVQPLKDFNFILPYEGAKYEIAVPYDASDNNQVPKEVGHPHNRFLNRRVRKRFSMGGKSKDQVCEGSVKSYNKRRQLFKVVYDDNDWEELDFQELQQVIVMGKAYGDKEREEGKTRDEILSHLKGIALANVAEKEIWARKTEQCHAAYERCEIFKDDDRINDVEGRGDLEVPIGQDGPTIYNDEPNNAAEVEKHPERDAIKAAAGKELQQFIDTGVGVLATKDEMNQIQEGTIKVLRSKILYKRKYVKDAVTGLERFLKWKGRIAVDGSMQVPGVDTVWNTFAPTIGFHAIRTILALTCDSKFEVDSYDLSGAFLGTELKDQAVFVRLPKDAGEYANKIIRLKKNVYGLKSSGSGFIKQLSEEILKFEEKVPGVKEPGKFRQLQSEQCVYVYEDGGGNKMIFFHYVDDIVCATNNRELRARFIAHLNKTWPVTHEGTLDRFLAVNFVRHKEKQKWSASMAGYIEKIARRFGLTETRIYKTPMEPGFMVHESDLEELDKMDRATREKLEEELRSIVGSVGYATTALRYDAAYAVSVLSRYLTKPCKKVMDAARRVVAWMYQTKDFELTWSTESVEDEGDHHRLYASADSSFAMDVMTRRSHGGYICFLNGGPVAWKSGLQQIVTLSSCEAEYVAVCAAVCEIKYLRNMLRELGYAQKQPTLIWEDNRAAILVSEQACSSAGRCKHVDIKYKFVARAIRDGEVILRYTPSSQNVADILTKPLTQAVFDRLKLLVAKPNQGDESVKHCIDHELYMLDVESLL